MPPADPGPGGGFNREAAAPVRRLRLVSPAVRKRRVVTAQELAQALVLLLALGAFLLGAAAVLMLAGRGWSLAFMALACAVMAGLLARGLNRHG